LFAIVFKALPDGKIALRDCIIGASFTAFLFMIGKFAIGFYLGSYNVASIYVWCSRLNHYYLDLGLLFGHHTLFWRRIYQGLCFNSWAKDNSKQIFRSDPKANSVYRHGKMRIIKPDHKKSRSKLNWNGFLNNKCLCMRIN